MFVFVFKELRRRQVRLDKRGAGGKADIAVRELRQVCKAAWRARIGTGEKQGGTGRERARGRKGCERTGFLVCHSRIGRLGVCPIRTISGACPNPGACRVGACILVTTGSERAAMNPNSACLRIIFSRTYSTLCISLGS